ncbi:hypothetical protein [Nocardia shimofusensis]|uniref:hypothetical protein n=1 Tax=Nocardia shimofusensis TaxID=228596 RepID=UPI000835D70A|nr:hypothetical protein [Nocardia shimofusensis]
MLLGCGRVSTVEQNPAHQVDAVDRTGVAEDIHIDTASSAKASGRNMYLETEGIVEMPAERTAVWAPTFTPIPTTAKTTPQ